MPNVTEMTLAFRYEGAWDSLEKRREDACALQSSAKRKRRSRLFRTARPPWRAVLASRKLSELECDESRIAFVTAMSLYYANIDSSVLLPPP
jgi:hypothetical protein